MREEQDETLKNLQKQLNELEHIINQTNELGDVQKLDQKYDVRKFFD